MQKQGKTSHVQTDHIEPVGQIDKERHLQPMAFCSLITLDPIFMYLQNIQQYLNSSAWAKSTGAGEYNVA